MTHKCTRSFAYATKHGTARRYAQSLADALPGNVTLLDLQSGAHVDLTQLNVFERLAMRLVAGVRENVSRFSEERVHTVAATLLAD